VCESEGVTKPDGEAKARYSIVVADASFFARPSRSLLAGAEGGHGWSNKQSARVFFGPVFAAARAVRAAGSVLGALITRADPDLKCPTLRQAQAPGSWPRAASSDEHSRYDPKDSELCLARAKPQETGVEARSRCDVQIHGIS